MAAPMPATKHLLFLLILKLTLCPMLICDTLGRWLPFGAEYRAALFSYIISHSDNKLNKAQTGPFPPPQTVPRFLNFLLSLQKSAMFLFYFTGYRCAQLGGISEYYNFCDWGINFHINTGYLVNFIKFWKQSFLYVILPMKCSIWKVFQLERTFQLYHL